jgi:hypothetical protein
MESGVEFVAVDNPHANKLTIHEHDREAISEQTKRLSRPLRRAERG